MPYLNLNPKFHFKQYSDPPPAPNRVVFRPPPKLLPLLLLCCLELSCECHTTQLQEVIPMTDLFFFVFFGFCDFFFWILNMKLEPRQDSQSYPFNLNLNLKSEQPIFKPKTPNPQPKSATSIQRWIGTDFRNPQPYIQTSCSNLNLQISTRTWNLNINLNLSLT